MNRRLHSESGFSVLSLMIASAIGLFLIAGIIRVYVDSKSSFNTRSAISTTTENLRFSIQDLRRTLVMTGRGIAQQNDGLAAYAGADNGLRAFPATGDFTNIAEDANGNSVIAIRYANGPAPCGQEPDLVDTINTVRFFINNDQELVCEISETAFSQPLVSDVMAMHALYGLDGADEDTTADRYVSASAMANSDWNFVVSIRIGLIGSSGDSFPLPEIYRSPTPETTDVLGMTYTAPNTEFVYKSASTTISFRNRNGIVQRQ